MMLSVKLGICSSLAWRRARRRLQKADLVWNVCVVSRVWFPCPCVCAGSPVIFIETSSAMSFATKSTFAGVALSKKISNGLRQRTKAMAAKPSWLPGSEFPPNLLDCDLPGQVSCRLLGHSLIYSSWIEWLVNLSL